MSNSLSYYEEDVIRLYIEEGKNAEATIKCLNEQHGTTFTVRQLKTNFNRLKKLSAREWQQIAREICKRQAQGLDSDVYFYGRRQDPERVKRALRRYGKEKEDSAPTEIDFSLRKHGRQRIQIRTPDAQDETQQADTGFRGIPHVTEKLGPASSMHFEAPIGPLNFMCDNGFGMSAEDQELDFPMEEIEPDFRTPQLGDLFNTVDVNRCSVSNIPSFVQVEDLDIDSLLPPQGDLLAMAEEPSDRPRQLALRQKGDSPFLITCNTSASFSSFINITNGLGAPSVPLLVSPEATSHMFGTHTENLIETDYLMPGSPWDHVHVRIPKGEPGWLASQLMDADPKLKHLTAMANLVERAFTDSQGVGGLRFEGHNKDSINDMFTVVAHLVLNKLISEKHVLNFIEWIIENRLLNHLYKFLHKGSIRMRTFIAKVLSAILNDAMKPRPGQSSYQLRNDIGYGEKSFIVKYPVETCQLIQAAGKRTLSSSLGGRLLVQTAMSGNFEAVKLLVSANSANVNYVGSDSTDNFSFPGSAWVTPLCAAIHGKSTDILCYLIDNGADINKRIHQSPCQTTALYEAVRFNNTDMVKFLLDGGGEPSYDLDINRLSILTYAERHSSAIYEILRDWAESRLDSEASICPLLLVEAAEKGNNSLSRFLFRHSNVRHEALESALWLAVKSKNLSAVRILLRRGVDPNALQYRRDQRAEDPDDHDQGPVSDAENSNSDAEGSDSDDETFELHDLAVEYGKESDEYFDSTHPVFLAIIDHSGPDSIDILYLLIKAAAHITVGALLDALNFPSLYLIEKCLVMVRLGFHANLAGPIALELCAKNGSIEQCDLLLDAGININSYGISGTPLQAAARAGRLALVQHLLERGADVHAPAQPKKERERYRHRRKCTALQGAALGGHYEVVNCLIEAGANVTISPADITDITLLEAAATASNGLQPFGSPDDGTEYDATRTFRMLLAHGAQINRTDGRACTVLHDLVTGSQLECLELVLKEKAATEERRMCSRNASFRVPKREVTPLQLAAWRHDMEILQLLLKYNADINAPASDSHPGLTVLQAAIAGPFNFRNKNTNQRVEETIVFLLQHKAEVNASASNKFGRTALQAATTLNEPSARIVSLLLQHKAEVNAPPAKEGGVTALQGAAISGDIHIAKMLLAHRANVNAPAAPINGRTAIEGAAEHGWLGMVRLLLDNRAMPDPNAGFSRAIKFAEDGHRYDIAELLKGREEIYASSYMGYVGQPFCDVGGPSSRNVTELPIDDEIVM